MNEHALVEETAKKWLIERGVTIQDIAELVFELQKVYYPKLTMKMCNENVERVLSKREVHNAILTGIQIDRLAEAGKLEAPLQGMIDRDEGLYGIDEVIALSIVNVYGSIGFTNYGYIDKVKPGILKKLNNKKYGCHTFLDDIVGAIAASASSRLAHREAGETED